PRPVRFLWIGGSVAGVRGALVVGGALLLRALVLDGVAARVHHVPLGAELVELLTVRVAGGGVARVPVQRVAVVDDLRRTVLALEGREHRAVDTVAGFGVAIRRDRWPCGRA